MTNPEVSTVSINSTSPTLVFSGCGRVDFRVVSITPGQRASFGGAAVTIANTDRWKDLGQLDAFETEFKANAEVYAISSSGTATIRIIRWF